MAFLYVGHVWFFEAGDLPFTPDADRVYCNRDTGEVKVGDGSTAWASLPGSAVSLAAHVAAGDPHTGYRLESADHSHASAGAQAGTLDHGTALTGLSDDDHPQYATNTEFDDHSARHEDGGADEISLTGLSGTPADLTTHAGAVDPHTGYRLESADHSHASTGAQGGQIAGADLTGTPGGELGGTFASFTVDATHSGSTHAAATTTHEAAADPHTGYLKEADIAAKGDLFGGTADNTVGILTAGANDTVLMADSGETTGLKWVASGTPGAIDATGGAGSADTFARGDHVHLHEAAHVAHDTVWAAKGDLISATANDTAAVTTAGANDTILMADSGAAGGIKWVASQTPSTQAFGDSAAEGTADTYARGDHKHTIPADPVTAHAAAGDPHTGYRLESADHDHSATGLQGGNLTATAITNRTRSLWLTPQAGLIGGTGAVTASIGANPDFIASIRFDDALAAASLSGFFQVPQDWASGALVCRVWFQMTATDVTAPPALRLDLGHKEVTSTGDPFSAITTIAVANVAAVSSTNMQTLDFTFFTPSAAGVAGRFYINRTSNNAGDTYEANMRIFACEIRYTADS